MDEAEIEARFRSINVWRRGHERAPHKPLLLLYALGRYSAGEPRLIPYDDVDRDLRALLVEFGPFRKSYHPEYPFWRLQTDGLWEVEAPAVLHTKASRTDVGKGELLKHGVRGGFLPTIYQAVVSSHSLTTRLAHLLLEESFPVTIHEDILCAVGLDTFSTYARKARDPRFRSRILTAYEFRCAVCDFDLRLGNTSVGLEAAHIMWHQAGGPDTEQNGLALCVLHHKLFDLGAFTLSHRLVIMLSAQAYGNHRFQDCLLAFHGRPLREPQDPRWVPGQAYLKWHQREVFKHPERYMPGQTPGHHFVAEGGP